MSEDAHVQFWRGAGGEVPPVKAHKDCFVTVIGKFDIDLQVKIYSTRLAACHLRESLKTGGFQV